MCQSPAQGLRSAHPRSRAQPCGEPSRCSEATSKTESSGRAKAKTETRGSSQPLPAQSSRVLKLLPGPRTAQRAEAAFRARKRRTALPLTLWLSPRPSPCGRQSERGAALAGASREHPPAGQSVERPRGGGAAAAARRGRGAAALRSGLRGRTTWRRPGWWRRGPVWHGEDAAAWGGGGGESRWGGRQGLRFLRWPDLRGTRAGPGPRLAVHQRKSTPGSEAFEGAPAPLRVRV